MNEIEKIEQYIAKTKFRHRVSGMSHEEWISITQGFDDIFLATALAFSFGRAKGYRAAKAEGRK